jgi:hypothetical protein
MVLPLAVRETLSSGTPHPGFSFIYPYYLHGEFSSNG